MSNPFLPPGVSQSDLDGEDAKCHFVEDILDRLSADRYDRLYGQWMQNFGEDFLAEFMKCDKTAQWPAMLAKFLKHRDRWIAERADELGYVANETAFARQSGRMLGLEDE